MTRGVPQGSVLGSTLWNIYYNDVLRLLIPPEVTLVAGADDLAVVVKGKTKETLEKTEAVLLAEQRKLKTYP